MKYCLHHEFKTDVAKIEFGTDTSDYATMLSVMYSILNAFADVLSIEKRDIKACLEQMDMSYSYKPILLKAILKHADKSGRVKIDDIVVYFKSFYESRRDRGLIVEKSNSIFAKGDYGGSKIT